MGEPEYELGELCDLAGVTVRTVRYYIQQGLLPGPGERGPGARYGEAHLDRLRLIKLLRRQDLPLAKIRALLESLDDEGVKAALERYAPQAPPPESSALEYVRAVRGATGPHGAPGPRGAQAPAPAPRRAARHPEVELDAAQQIALQQPTAPSEAMLWSESHRRIHEDSLAAATASAKPGAATRSQWERIGLTPDVELHVRRPLSRHDNRKVESLVKLARDLFDEEGP
jgi:DNA-binding transcriptional MerR regulator